MAAIQVLDATKETHKRWASYGLRLLAVNGKANLVRQVLEDYSDQIQSLQQGSTVTEWFIWSKMYEAVGLLAERDRCWNAIVLAKPEGQSEWFDWLSFTAHWLEQHLEDSQVRTKYLAMIEQCSTPKRKREAIALTATWLQQHSDDREVRKQYLALIRQCGTAQQQREAIALTATWLQHHPQNVSVLNQYLKLIRQCGSLKQKREGIALTATWLQHHPENVPILKKYLKLLEKYGSLEQKQEGIALTTTWLRHHPENINILFRIFGNF